MFEFAIKRLEKKISLLKAEISYNYERKLKHREYNEDTSYEQNCIDAINYSIVTLKNIDSGKYNFDDNINAWLKDYLNIGGMHIKESLMEFQVHKYTIGILIADMSRTSFSEDDIRSLRNAKTYLERDAVFYACFTEIGKWMREAPLKNYNVINID